MDASKPGDRRIHMRNAWCKVIKAVLIYVYLSFFRFIKLSSGILQIINVQEGDTGSYRCQATQGSLHELPNEVDNIYVKTSAEAFLEVYTGKAHC